MLEIVAKRIWRVTVAGIPTRRKPINISLLEWKSIDKVPRYWQKCKDSDGPENYLISYQNCKKMFEFQPRGVYTFLYNTFCSFKEAKILNINLLKKSGVTRIHEFLRKTPHNLIEIIFKKCVITHSYFE